MNKLFMIMKQIHIVQILILLVCSSVFLIYSPAFIIFNNLPFYSQTTRLFILVGALGSYYFLLTSGRLNGLVKKCRAMLIKAGMGYLCAVNALLCYVQAIIMFHKFKLALINFYKPLKMSVFSIPVNLIFDMSVHNDTVFSNAKLLLTFENDELMLLASAQEITVVKGTCLSNNLRIQLFLQKIANYFTKRDVSLFSVLLPICGESLFESEGDYEGEVISKINFIASSLIKKLKYKPQLCFLLYQNSLMTKSHAFYECHEMFGGSSLPVLAIASEFALAKSIDTYKLTFFKMLNADLTKDEAASFFLFLSSLTQLATKTMRLVSHFPQLPWKNLFFVGSGKELTIPHYPMPPKANVDRIYNKQYFSIFCVVFSMLLALSYTFNIKQIDRMSLTALDYGNIFPHQPHSASCLTYSIPPLIDAYQIQNNYRFFQGFGVLNFEIIFPAYLHYKLLKFTRFNGDKFFSPFVADISNHYALKRNRDTQNDYNFLRGNLFADKRRLYLEKILHQYLDGNQLNLPDEVSTYFFKNTLNHGDIFSAQDPVLDKQIQSYLRKFPIEKLLTYELHYIAQNEEQKFPFKMNKLSDVFEGEGVESIPSVFSVDGFHRLWSKDIFSYEKNISLVINDGAALSTVHPRNLNLFWQGYENDYIQYWDSFLQSLKIKKFTSLKEAVESLKCLNKNVNPITSVLDQLKDNSYPLLNERSKIFMHYNAINNVTGQLGNRSKDLAIFNNDVKQLFNYISTIENSADILRTEFDEAKSIFSGEKPNNPVLVMLSHAKSLPEPLRSWTQQIATNTLDVLLHDSLIYMQPIWLSQVYHYYQSDIKNYFPFNNQAHENINPSNFNLFFNDKGVFQVFINQYIQPFVDTAHEPWLAKDIEKHGLPISQPILQSLSRFHQVAKLVTLDAQSSLIFHIAPRYLDAHINEIAFTLAEDSFTYKHGIQRFFSLRCPAENKPVSITIVDVNTQEKTVSYEGDWGLFRFISGSSCKNKGNGLYFCDTLINGYKFLYEFEFNSKLGNIDLNFSTLALPENL